MGALSYAGGFTIGVVADQDAFPDLDVFAAGAREELHALGRLTYPTSVRPGRVRWALVQPATGDRLWTRATTVRLSPKPVVISGGRW